MEELKIKIIAKMSRRRHYAHKMINFSDLLRVVATNERGDAKRCIYELYKEGFLNRKPGVQKEFRYSLRTEKQAEIDEMRCEYYGRHKEDTFNNDTFNV